MKKWYNFETAVMSLADALSAYLKRNGFYYERSGAYGNYHFEILADEKDVNEINAFLDASTIQGVNFYEIRKTFG